MDGLRDFVVKVGNTIGRNIPHTCPKCGTTSKISDYGGNIVDRTSTCPNCGSCIH